ncbi:MAG: hypothetical protein AB8B99_15975 [Phormidesmis sp.]
MSDPRKNDQSQISEQLSDSTLKEVSGGEKDPCAGVDPCAGTDPCAGEDGAGEKGFFKYKKKKFFHGGHHH